MSRRWITRTKREQTGPALISSDDGAPFDPRPIDLRPVDPSSGATYAQAASGASEPPRVAPAWLVAVAALLACSAIVASSMWWQHRSRVVEVTHQVKPSYPAGPDSIGCPNLSRCQVRADLGHPLNALARQLFPDATVLSSVSVAESDTGRTVRTTIVLRTPSGVVVSAGAQCVPGAGPVPGRFGSLPAAGPAQADFVVAGAAGCSVAVAARIPRAAPVPLAELQRLARDPGVQLRP